MKYVCSIIFWGVVLVASAQPAGNMRGENALSGGNREQSNNTLLNPSFWQNQPGVEAVKAEVAKGNSPSEMNAMSMDPVVVAINAGAPGESIVYLLQQEGNDVNKITHDSRTYIFWAATRGNTEVMEYLLSKGARIDVRD